MKKLCKILVLFCMALCACIGSCTTIWEEGWIEHIPRPAIEIDTITVPPWEEMEKKKQ